MNNLITVIIPVYNGASSLEQCLNSVVSQTHKNLEIIVINDGSTDQSAEIINRFAEQDQRIVAVHQHNQGVSAARNVGLAKASGELIGFVDGDDEVLPDMYEFLLNNLLRYDADISHCGFELIKKNSTVKFHDTGIVLVQDRWEGVKEILSGQRIEPGIWNKLYKKNVLSGVTFPMDIKNNEDVFFNVEVFYNSEKSVFEDLVKYRYLHNSESASRTSFTEKKARDMYEVSKRIKNLLKEKEIKDFAQHFYGGKLLSLLQVLRQNGLQNTKIGKTLYAEVSELDVKNMGFRANLMKIILVKFPFLYSISRLFYDVIFSKNHKWKNH